MPDGPPAVAAAAVMATASAAASDGPQVADAGTFAGFCEASAIVAWDGGYVVADNETHDRLYGFDALLRPRAIPFDPPMEVADAEALVAFPGGLLVVGSQSRNNRGERKPKRERVQLRGKAPAKVDLSACAACERARGDAPNHGGLNVEGAAWWNGSLWLGLRSPLVDGDRHGHGKALLLRMEGDPALELRATAVIKVDLENRGVQDLTVQGDRLLILAGSPEDARTEHRLYRLTSPEAAPELIRAGLAPFTEGIAPTPDGAWLVVTDGDGKPGAPCVTSATWQKIRL